MFSYPEPPQIANLGGTTRMTDTTNPSHPANDTMAIVSATGSPHTNSLAQFSLADASPPPPPMVLSIGTYVRHYQGKIRPSLGLSIDDRAREMRAHLGFDHTVRTHRLSPSSLVMSCRDCYAYLEYAQ